MQINVANPQQQTAIVLITLFLLILVTLRKRNISTGLDLGMTAQLKGIAALLVMFSHIGMFLSKDQRFLYPISISAGVAVDIFLFLSGFGLTITYLKRELRIKEFYLTRFKPIFMPMWISVTILFLLDFFILNKQYPLYDYIYSYLGYFPKADIFTSIDSPLWYFTFFLFYCLLFPLLFWKKRPYLTSFVLLLIGFLLLKQDLPVDRDVQRLYKLHFISLPLGILVVPIYSSNLFKKLCTFFGRYVNVAVSTVLSISLFYLFSYLTTHSWVGRTELTEETGSLITMSVLILSLLFLNLKSLFLEYVGEYSYFIYLLHWPIMYRFDFIYKYLPAGVATILYVFFFLGVSVILTKVVNLFNKKPKNIVSA